MAACQSFFWSRDSQLHCIQNFNGKMPLISPKSSTVLSPRMWKEFWRITETVGTGCQKVKLASLNCTEVQKSEVVLIALSDLSSYSAVGCLLLVAIYGATGGSALCFYSPGRGAESWFIFQIERARIPAHVLWRNSVSHCKCSMLFLESIELVTIQ